MLLERWEEGQEAGSRVSGRVSSHVVTLKGGVRESEPALRSSTDPGPSFHAPDVGELNPSMVSLMIDILTNALILGKR